MMKTLQPGFGFEAGVDRDAVAIGKRLAGCRHLGAAARFSPEFVNRVDSVITYQPLSPESLGQILRKSSSPIFSATFTAGSDRGRFNSRSPAPAAAS